MKRTVTNKMPNHEDLSDDLAPVYSYWQDRIDGEFAPLTRSFLLDELAPEVLPWAMLVEVIPEPLDFIYRFWGTQRAIARQYDYTGHSVSDVAPAETGLRLHNEYSQVVAARTPLLFSAQGVNDYNEPVNWDALRLPLTNNGETVDRIFSFSFGSDRAVDVNESYFNIQRKVRHDPH